MSTETTCGRAEALQASMRAMAEAAAKLAADLRETSRELAGILPPEQGPAEHPAPTEAAGDVPAAPRQDAAQERSAPAEPPAPDAPEDAPDAPRKKAPASERVSPAGGTPPPPSGDDRRILENKARDLLNEIRFAAMDGRDYGPMVDRLRLLMRGVPDWDVDAQVERMLEQARKNLAERRRLQKLVSEHGVTSDEVLAWWREVPKRVPWFRNKGRRELIRALSFQLRKAGRNGGENVLEAALRLFGEIPEELGAPSRRPDTTPEGPNVQPRRPAPLPEVRRGTIHGLLRLEPSPEWNVVIDETGTRFAREEQGSAGRMVAVCFPTGVAPQLRNFHGAETDPAQVADALNTLLDSPCGILGIPAAALGISGEEAWLQNVQEIMRWVWRLLPIPETGAPSGVRFLIEQRAEFTPDRNAWIAQKLTTGFLTRENPERSGRLIVLGVDFGRKHEGLLDWADVVAYCWGTSNRELKTRLKDGGLMGSCLVDLDADILGTCDRILRGERPDGADWTALLAHPTSADPHSLISRCLETLASLCGDDADRWRPYVDAMSAYLAEKHYDLSVLERMGTWLSGIRNPGMEVEFFWRMAELARLNHMGEIRGEAFSATAARVEELVPSMAKIAPQAAWQAQMRLAVADADAFDFAGAERRLARWNPYADGRLPGSALWDGKFLSSLGQYRAFQGDPGEAAALFRHALRAFDSLRAGMPEEADRQMGQTRTYLAITLMDQKNVPDDVERKAVEAALGESVESAAAAMAEGGTADRYRHHLLVRHLNLRGTQEERAIYLGGRHRWTTEGSGMGIGHPWPQIQYHRWRLLDEDDAGLREDVAKSLMPAMGRNAGDTVMLIVFALGISMGELDPKEENVRSLLLRLAAYMPAAEGLVERMLASFSGDASLAERVLPFNYL